MANNNNNNNKRPVLQRTQPITNKVQHEQDRMQVLHNIFDNKVAKPTRSISSDAGNNNQRGTGAAAAASFTAPKHTPITSPPLASTSQQHPPYILHSSSSSTGANSSSLTTATSTSPFVKPLSTRLLNDPLSNLKNSGGTPSAAAGKGKKGRHQRTPIVCADDAQVSYDRQQEGQFCKVCNLRDPMPRQSFIDHIMGKKHRITDHKQKLSKQQKIDRDARTLHVRGFDSRTLPEEICGLFWEHGFVDIQASNKHVFVEFEDKAAAIAALSAQITTANGRRLQMSLRTERNHSDDKVVDEPVEVFLTPAIRTLVGIIPRTEADLNDTVERILNDIQLKPEEYENRQYVRDRIEHFLRLEFQNVKCHIFGSSSNNLGFHGADVDLYAALGYDPYDCPRAADGEAAAAKLTYYLAKHLRRQHWISNVEAIPKARVPIVKFKQSGIAVDLSFRNGMPVQNTALIRLYTYTHPLVRPYMMLVRFWAKMQRLAGGGKPSILITNYALTMLMAFVIQRGREIIPSLYQLRSNSYRRNIINGWNCGFGEDTKFYAQKVHNCSVLELVLEFFQYYAKLDTTEFVICPLVGRLVQRRSFVSKCVQKLGPELQDYANAPGTLQHETPLCVQDPFDLTHNVTRGLTMIALERFKLLCKQSASLLQRVIQLERPLVALFQPIEVTDDMYSVEEGAELRDDNPPLVTVQDDSMTEEVIVLDDSDADTTQDIEIIEEVQKVIKEHEDIKVIRDDNNGNTVVSGNSNTNTVVSGNSDTTVSGDTNTAAGGAADTFQVSNSDTSRGGNNGSTKKKQRENAHGTKRMMESCGGGVTDNTTIDTLSPAEVTLCSQIQLDSTTVYQIRLNPDIVYKIGSDTGVLTPVEDQATHTVESARYLALDIITFIFSKIYLGDVVRTEMSLESPNKRIKNSSASSGSGKTLACYAKLDVTFKYELLTGRGKVQAVNTLQTEDQISPFTMERHLSLQQMRLIQQGQTKKFGTVMPEGKKFSFLVCHNTDKITEVVVIANTLEVSSKEDDTFLTRFCTRYGQLTNTCLRKANQLVNRSKGIVS